MSYLQNFTTEEILSQHKKQCLLINESQTVKYETRIIKFKNYEKQIPIPFKIYADTEFLLKRININESKYTKLYQKHIPNSKGAKLVCMDNINLLYQQLFLKAKILSINLLNEFLSNKNIVIK